MTNTEILVIGLLTLFAVVAVIVFRERRWQGALGWIMIAGAFIVSLLRRDNATLASTLLAAAVVVAGISLAGYDYFRFERPKRKARREERLAAGHVTFAQRLRRRPRLLRRRQPEGSGPAEKR
ncbi:MAG TPA: hypothetical protein VGE07_24010 [Herpetosiphonaceae bacterium]